MKKKVFKMLPCIAAVGIAVFIGKKYYDSHVSEANGLLMQNVAALSSGEAAQRYNLCYFESKVVKGRTYYDCVNCQTKVYDEKGVGTVSKCFY